MLSLIQVDQLRSEAVRYIKSWIGTPYKHGGDDFSGWDCSGLVVETFQSVGLLGYKEDYSANGLYLKFKKGRIVELTEEKPYPYHGCLVFWFRNGEAKHVAMTINEFQVCEAAGGDSETKTEEDAKRDNAYVRIRRIDYRGDNFKIVDPFKNWTGQTE